MKPYKKTILIDLDGVLNTYTGGYDENYIPPIREGAYDFIKDLSNSYKIVLFTSRNIALASKWLFENSLDKYFHHVTNTKEPAFLIVDDRGLNFDGNYEKTVEKIKNFKTWYK